MISGLFSCSSSKSGNDTDIIPDSDSDDSETIIDDDKDSEEDLDFIDDSEEIPDDTNSINGYARCYDEIPDDPYEGFFC